MKGAEGPEIPQTRWERTTEPSYGDLFEALIERGEDVDGEARLVDVLAPRHARILDGGSGMGRVAAALVRRGHDVTAVEKDPDLIARSRRLFPDLPLVEADLLELSGPMLEARARPASYDVVVLVGNVMIYLADDTEVRVLRLLAGLLLPGGRIVVGFHPRKGPPHSRDYPVQEFRQHVLEAGLEVVQLFGSYELAPPAEDYVVAVLGSAPELV